MPTLLVIEDSPTVRKLVELSFARQPWSVLYAPSGADGLRLAREAKPDVILLDCVLPDMNGRDVCTQLARQPAAGGPARIVLMTAKEERIRLEFTDFPSVVDYVTKPFSPDLIVSKANAALRAVPPTAASASVSRPSASSLSANGTPSSTQTGLRQALYAGLRSALTRLPALLAESPSAPAGFLANALLSDEVMSEINDEVGFLLGDGGRGPSTAESRPLPAIGPIVTPLDVLELLQRKRATGRLHVSNDTLRVVIAYDRGQVIHASSESVDEELALAELDPGEFTANALAKARAGHEAGTEPLVIGLRRAGALEPARAAAITDTIGARLLARVANARDVGYRWHEAAKGSSATDLHAGLDLRQARLEWLREGAAMTTELRPGVTIRRPQGFSARVLGLDLTAEEKLVLAVVSTPTALAQIAPRIERPPYAVETIVRRLLEVELLETCVPVPKQSASHRVLVCEPEKDAREALEAMIASSLPYAETVHCREIGDVEAALDDGSALAAIINVEGRADAASALISGLRASAAHGRTHFVAVVDVHSSSLEEQAVASGFDLALVKPLHMADLQALILGG